MRVVAACLPRLHPMAAFRAAILGALLPVVMGQTCSVLLNNMYCANPDSTYFGFDAVAYDSATACFAKCQAEGLTNPIISYSPGNCRCSHDGQCGISSWSWTSNSAWKGYTCSAPAPAGGACACQDPHLNLAHGGRADFRGRHGELYNFLSSKDGAMLGLDPC